MGKVLKLMLVALLATQLVACANIKDDATRTKTEGTLAGAGIGAGVGALLGGLIDGGRGAAIGAGIGAGLGAAGGYMVGKHVADKKAEYASKEDWLDDCIAYSEQTNAQARQYNDKLSREIKSLDAQSRSLVAQYKSRQAKLGQLKSEAKTVKKLQNDSSRAISNLEADRSKQVAVAREARASGDKRRAQKLDSEIKKLDQEIRRMRDYNNQLANISVRLAV